MREHVVRHAPFSSYYVARMKLNRNIVEGVSLLLVTRCNKVVIWYNLSNYLVELQQ